MSAIDLALAEQQRSEISERLRKLSLADRLADSELVKKEIQGYRDTLSDYYHALVAAISGAENLLGRGFPKIPDNVFSNEFNEDVLKDAKDLLGLSNSDEVVKVNMGAKVRGSQ